MNEWVDAREVKPLADGYYIVQTVYGNIEGMEYTFEAGWNTYHTASGALNADVAIEDEYIARWYKLETPPPVPKEWFEDYWKKYWGVS